MLRRALLVLRIAFAALGVVCVLLLAGSTFLHASVFSRWPPEAVYATLEPGSLHLGWWQDASSPDLSLSASSVVLHRIDPVMPTEWWPRVVKVRFPGAVATAVHLPLWLLAFLCLAWPVTSFVARRKGRGFGVEVRDQKSEVSQRAEDAAIKPSDL